MRKYNPPPNMKQYGKCWCDDGTLYEVENLEIELCLCAQCGYVGVVNKEGADSVKHLKDNYESSRLTNVDNCKERVDTLEKLISDGFNWLGVAAPRTQASTKSYRDLVKRFAAVRQRVKAKKNSP